MGLAPQQVVPVRRPDRCSLWCLSQFFQQPPRVRRLATSATTGAQAHTDAALPRRNKSGLELRPLARSKCREVREQRRGANKRTADPQPCRRAARREASRQRSAPRPRRTPAAETASGTADTCAGRGDHRNRPSKTGWRPASRRWRIPQGKRHGGSRMPARTASTVARVRPKEHATNNRRHPAADARQPAQQQLASN
jgi:hypothetical protein